MFSMGGLYADCGLLAEQFCNIEFIVTHWTNCVVVPILQRAHHSLRLLVLGTRAQRITIKAVITTILQSKSINVKLVEGVEHTKVVAR